MRPAAKAGSHAARGGPTAHGAPCALTLWLTVPAAAAAATKRRSLSRFTSSMDRGGWPSWPSPATRRVVCVCVCRVAVPWLSWPLACCPLRGAALPELTPPLARLVCCHAPPPLALQFAFQEPGTNEEIKKFAEGYGFQGEQRQPACEPPSSQRGNEWLGWPAARRAGSAAP